MTSVTSGRFAAVGDERADRACCCGRERRAVVRREDDGAGRAAVVGQFPPELGDDVAGGGARHVEARREAFEADEEAADRDREDRDPADDDDPGAPRGEGPQSVEQFSHGAPSRSISIR